MLQGLSILAAGAAVAAVSLPAVAAGAEQDCATLSSIVYERVLAHGLNAPVPGNISVPAVGEVECERFVPAITRGFSDAMRDMDVHLSWKSPARTRGDLCLGADLSQCYPDRSPAVPLLRDDRAFVADAWSAVRRAIAAASARCPSPAARLRFSPSNLQQRLDTSLLELLREGRQQAYYLPSALP